MGRAVTFCPFQSAHRASGKAINSGGFGGLAPHYKYDDFLVRNRVFHPCPETLFWVDFRFTVFDGFGIGLAAR